MRRKALLLLPILVLAINRSAVAGDESFKDGIYTGSFKAEL